MFLWQILSLSLLFATIQAVSDNVTKLEYDNVTESAVKTTAKVECHHLGKTYQEGEHIETPDRACFHCNCYAGWTEPSSFGCAIIDCPWGYYKSKPYCTIEYIKGRCCPELRCSVPGPEFDKSYIGGKRSRLSTHGYNITAAAESELTLYCTVDNDTIGDNKTISATWTLESEGKSIEIENGTLDIELAEFPNNIWALHFWHVKRGHEGIYVCKLSSTPKKMQKTTLIVRTGDLPLYTGPKCKKPIYVDLAPTKCSMATPASEYDMPWYYNTTSRQCEQHKSISCEYYGSENFFNSSGDCWNHCEFNCVGGGERGDCNEQLTRYFYDYSRDLCQQFSYSGCGGSINNYKSTEECEDFCANIKFRDTLTDGQPEAILK